jgi:hypothetical protein
MPVPFANLPEGQEIPSELNKRIADLAFLGEWCAEVQRRDDTRDTSQERWASGAHRLMPGSPLASGSPKSTTADDGLRSTIAFRDSYLEEESRDRGGASDTTASDAQAQYSPVLVVHEYSPRGPRREGQGFERDPSATASHSASRHGSSIGLTESNLEANLLPLLTVPRGDRGLIPHSGSASSDSPAAGISSFMLRGIPNRLKVEVLLDRIYSTGFGESFDFFYMPLDTTGRQNKGYAFINFTDEKEAAEFLRRFNGMRFECRASTKEIQVCKADAQGRLENLQTITHSNWSQKQHMPLVRVDGRLMHLTPLAAIEILRMEKQHGNQES